MFHMEKVGKKIAQLRKSHNMTQLELADKMGISFQAVSNWERGISMPDIAKLPELAELFQVTVDELLGEKSGLVESAIRDDLEKYLEDNHVSTEEICNVAPILKPDQITVVFESQKEIDLSELNHILPFLHEDVVDKLLIKVVEEGEYRKLYNIVPFASEAAITDVTHQLYQKFGMSGLKKVAPFIPEKQLRQIAEQEYVRNGLCDLSPIAPFLPSDYLNELAREAVRKDGIKAISSIAPFLDSEILSEWVKEVYL